MQILISRNSLYSEWTSCAVSTQGQTNSLSNWRWGETKSRWSPKQWNGPNSVYLLKRLVMLQFIICQKICKISFKWRYIYFKCFTWYPMQGNWQWYISYISNKEHLGRVWCVPNIFLQLCTVEILWSLRAIVLTQEVFQASFGK